MVRGESAEIKDYPYLVFLGNNNYFCGGAIISRRYVLTAAHCVRKPKDKLFIRAGSNSRTKGGSLHHLETVIPHENFFVDSKGQRSSFDLAVVRVSEPFEYDATRQPIRLFNRGEKLRTQLDAKAAGWGNNENYVFPDKFRKLDHRIVDRVSCNRTFESWGGILENQQFCAASKDQRHRFACSGDSGSPLAVEGRLAGVTIYGGGCEIKNSPTVYSEVAHFRDWIDQHVIYDDSGQVKGSPSTKNDIEGRDSDKGEFQESKLGNGTLSESNYLLEATSATVDHIFKFFYV